MSRPLALAFAPVWILASGCGGTPAAPDAAGPGDGTVSDAPGDGAVGDETWRWVDVPGMKCGDGSATGIAINHSTRSSRMAIVVAGGGACWEAAACYGIVIPQTATYLDGFGAAQFAQLRASALDPHWLLQRDDPASAFHDATWVFVPYCTGDLHAGTRTTTYDVLGTPRTMHHVGANNVDAMLAAIAPYAPTEVFAVGISAGGYGIQLNWDRIAAAFPGATTHVLADGAQLVAFESSRWGTLTARWAPRFPQGCADCAARLDHVAAHWRAAPPAGGGRHGLLVSLADETIALFFGYDQAGLRAASTAIAAPMTGHAGAFILDTTAHTLLGAPAAMTSTGVAVRPWVEAWAGAAGATTFETVGP